MRKRLKKLLGDLASVLFVSTQDRNDFRFYLPAGLGRDFEISLSGKPKFNDISFAKFQYLKTINSVFATSAIPGMPKSTMWSSSYVLGNELIRYTRLYAVYLNEHLERIGAPPEARVDIANLFSQSEMNHLGSLDEAIRRGTTGGRLRSYELVFQ